MLKAISAAVLISAAAMGGAYAQSANDNSSTTPPAVTRGSAESKTSAAPVPGANSFTEAEARKRLEGFGYSNVSGLKKDDQSIWRGTATKDGREGPVSLDYQGNIVQK